ncbi:MAG: DedA family protein [Dactylosporangium sp.]|nr:VTT domain-containing protein [Dactylosporangium sp.]NNJ63792.1 DedA family protein [Dactylosporangium sp.]
MAHWLAELANLPTTLLTALLGIIMLLDGIPVLGLLIPADAAVMLAMAAKGPLGSVPVLIGVVGGYLVTASLGFLVGRHFGPQVRSSRFGAWIGEPRWMLGERLLTAKGAHMLVATPFLPVVSTVVPLIAGGLRVPYRRFVCFVAVGSIAWAGLYVALGALAGVIGSILPGGTVATLASIVVGMLLSITAIPRLRQLITTPAPTPVTTPTSAPTG